MVSGSATAAYHKTPRPANQPDVANRVGSCKPGPIAMSDSRPSPSDATAATPEDLALRIARSMPSDQRGFRRRLQSIRKAARAGKPHDRNLKRLAEDVLRSESRRSARAANVPAVRFEQDLPILARREEISAAIREHRVIVVCGETGSGKSTQLPKICLAAGRGLGVGSGTLSRGGSRPGASRPGWPKSWAGGRWEKRLATKFGFMTARGPSRTSK